MPTLAQIETDFRRMLVEWGETLTHSGGTVDAILDLARAEPVHEDGGGERDRILASLTWWATDLEDVAVDRLFTRADGSVWRVTTTPVIEDGVATVDVQQDTQRRVGRH